MAKRKIFWHIGPDDLGTEFMAPALWRTAEELAAAQVSLPGGPRLWRRATAELTHGHALQGWTRGEVEGATDKLVREIWRHKGTTLLSTPGLAPISADRVRLALDGFRGAELHIVLVVRNLTSQVYAAAQTMLERGGSSKPISYVERVLADSEPPAEHPQRAQFRAGHDMVGLISRWAGDLPAEQIHVIGADEPELIWAAVADLVGAPVLFPGAPHPQTSLGGLDLLRSTLLEIGAGVLTAHTVRDQLSRGLLGLPRPALPPLPVEHIIDEWRLALERKGIAVTGQLRAVGSEGFDEISIEEALVRAMGEIATQQAQIEALRSENEQLDKKRRKHKRRLKELQLGGPRG